MEDWLKKWYKEGFEKSKVNSPKKNWEKIAAELAEWPAHWYKSNADKVGIKPKHTNWDAIKKGLSDMPVRKRAPIFQFRAIVLVAVVFLLPFLLINPDFHAPNPELSNFDGGNLKIQNAVQEVANHKSLTTKERNYKNKDRRQENKATANEHENFSNLTSEKTDSNEGFLPIRKRIDPSKTVDNNQKESTKKAAASSKIEKTDSNQAENNTPLIAKQEQIPDKVDKLPVKTLNLAKSKNSFSSGLNDIKNPLIYNGWYIGGGAVLQRATLLNPISSRSLAEGSGVVSSPNLNVSINLNVMKQLKNRNAFSAYVMLNNNKSQRYTETNFDEVAEGQISLDYVLVGANYHSRLLESYDNTLSLNSVMGLYSAINTGISEHKNTEQIDFLKGGFRNYDVGVSFGFETNFYLNSKWMIYSDLIYQLGVINIFNGTDKVPADFFHTQTSSLNLGLGIRRNL